MNIENFIAKKNKKLKNILLKKEIFAFDKDGTLNYDMTPIPGAKDFLLFLRKLKKEIVVLTNNSSIPNKKHLEMIENIFNMDFSLNNVYSSLDHLADYLKKMNIKKVFPLLNKDSLEYVKSLTPIIEDYDKPQYILVGFHTEGFYRDWAKASLLIQKDIPYIIVNPDLRCPTENGFIPDAGSIAKMIELTTDKKAIYSCGKPNPEILELLLERYNKSKEDIVYFGDRLYTDIEMGINSGITTILMLTGETKLDEVTEEIVNNENIYIIKDYYELLELLK